MKHPSVSGWGLTDEVTVMYEDDGQIYRKILESGADEWTGQLLGSGREPTIAVHRHSGLYLADAGAVWVKENSAPYIVETDYQDTPEFYEAIAAIPSAGAESMGRIQSYPLISFKRMDFLPPGDTTGTVFMAAGIREAYLDSTALEFDWEMFSDPLTVSTADTFSFQLICQFHRADAVVDTAALLWRLSLRENESITHPLTEVRVADLLAYNDGARHVIPVSIPLSGLAGVSGRLHFERNGLPSEVREVVIHPDSLSERILLTKGYANQGNSQAQTPKSFALRQNYPNPFNPTTTIAFDLPHNSFVELEIYDISGRRVRVVVNENMEAGSHQVAWDGRDEAGNQAASGVYFYRIQAVPLSGSKEAFTAVSKMVLLK